MREIDTENKKKQMCLIKCKTSFSEKNKVKHFPLNYHLDNEDLEYLNKRSSRSLAFPVKQTLQLRFPGTNYKLIMNGKH